MCRIALLNTTHRLLLAAAVVGGMACSGPAVPATQDPAAAALAALPACDRTSSSPSEPEQAADLPGLVLPKTSQVIDVVTQGPLVTVTAEVDRTPIEVRAAYEARNDIDVVSAEDETFESEILVRSDNRRMYLRATALCADGSGLTAVVGPDRDDAGLPELRNGG